MIEIKKHLFPWCVKREWKELEKNNPLVGPFQSFRFFSLAWKYWYPYVLRSKHLPIVYELNRGGDVKCLFTGVCKNSRGVVLFGNENGHNYCDAVYRDVDALQECALALKQKFGKVICYRVMESSPLYKAVKDHVKVINSHTNVKIEFGDDFDAYIKTLSKSTRQNLRTAFNRLAKDGHSYRLEVWQGGDKGVKKVYKCCLNLYARRHEERYGVKTGALKKWFLLHQNFATVNYLKNRDALTFVLFINDEIVAFMSGVCGRASQYVVPRLSINSDYKFYSPGMLLIHETIKYMISNMDIRCLDLSLGEEEYKYKMGGIAHLTVDFEY